MAWASRGEPGDEATPDSQHNGTLTHSCTGIAVAMSGDDGLTIRNTRESKSSRAKCAASASPNLQWISIALKTACSISEYVAELRRLAARCDFGTHLVRDRLVCGVKSESIQKRLLSEADLTLAKAVKLATTMEAEHKNAQTLKSSSLFVGKVDRPSWTPSTRPSPIARLPLAVTHPCSRCFGIWVGCGNLTQLPRWLRVANRFYLADTDQQ